METRSHHRECPECGVKLTRYEWSRHWWMSGVMSGRLVQPCGECGVKLRTSSMALVAGVASLGIIVTAGFYVFNRSDILLFVALALLLVVLIAMMVTRLENVPKLGSALDLPPERVGKKRL